MSKECKYNTTEYEDYEDYNNLPPTLQHFIAKTDYPHQHHHHHQIIRYTNLPHYMGSIMIICNANALELHNGCYKYCTILPHNLQHFINYGRYISIYYERQETATYIAQCCTYIDAFYIDNMDYLSYSLITYSGHTGYAISHDNLPINLQKVRSTYFLYCNQRNYPVSYVKLLLQPKV
jgi:hypothetical protein